jgi:hypothetical protein
VATIEPLLRAEGLLPTRDEFTGADAFCRSVSASSFFAESVPIVLSRAPGRLDVLGGVADYSGSLVLELPLEAAALAAAQASDDGTVVAVSGDLRMTLDVAALVDEPLAELSARFVGPAAWGAYVLGPIALLLREERTAPGGLRVLVSSDVPQGKGLASSAAIGVAVLQAVAACFGHAADPRRLASSAARPRSSARSHFRLHSPCGGSTRASAAPSRAPPTVGPGVPRSWARRCSAARTSTSPPSTRRRSTPSGCPSG